MAGLVTLPCQGSLHWLMLVRYERSHP